MPLPGNKATTPFKNMDIKAAFLSAGNRKRKASSPQRSKDEPKNIKLDAENNDVEILNEACGIPVTVQSSEIDSALGDCKENKDINGIKLESTADCKENNLPSPIKEQSPSVNKTPLKLSNLDSSKEIISDVELLSDKSTKSENSSCDEHNDSVNVSLNTSGRSVSGNDESDKDNNSKINNEESGTPKTEKDTKERTKKKKMTPAEASKKTEEREQKQKERLLKKQEMEKRKRERLLEKEQKLKEKLLRKEREEIERKERERIKQEKKEQEEKERLQKQKEKEEKAKIKQMQLEMKLEEKKKKEEMRLKKEEEMKKAEEEKLRLKLEKEQKEKEKKERAKAAFVKFFVKPETNTSVPSAQVTEKEGAFLPFQVSDDMILAPVVPPAAQERFDKKQLDHYLEFQDCCELYLQVLKSGSYKDVRQRKRNKKLEASEADVIVIDENAQAELGLCPKLLQFSENVRPPYWGTWRKKSKNVHGRNPFGQDEIFDYSVDSDDEWDEGGPGESLSGTENEDESEDEYEVDNEFFVPHGYLSDEEERKEDDDDEVDDPEKQKARLKLKQQEFEMQLKKKTAELKPIILGCYFANVHDQDSKLQTFLQNFSAELISESPIPTSFTIKSQQMDCGSNNAESPKSANNKKKKIVSMPEKAFPHLIRLVHGNIKKRKILSEEFQKFCIELAGENQEATQETSEQSSNTEIDPSKESVGDISSDLAQISLRLINQTIRDIASYGKPPDSTFNKCCWWVHDNIRQKYDLMDAPVPNQWKYVSQKEPEPAAKINSASIKEFLSTN